MYFALKKSTAAAAADLASAPAAVSLFHQWANGCCSNEKLRQQVRGALAPARGVPSRHPLTPLPSAILPPLPSNPV